MRGVSGFHGGAEAAALEKDYVGLGEGAMSRYAAGLRGHVGRGGEGEGDAGREDEELELGLSLGAKKAATAAGGGCGGGGRAAPWGDYCRILTAKDFPSLGSRASPRSSTSSVSSSTPALCGGAGTKRGADSVASDAGGSTSPPSPVVVGWPPVAAFRMNTLVNQSRDNYLDSNATAHKKNNHGKTSEVEGAGGKVQEKKGGHAMATRFVKVNMDGDPIGRKVDLNGHQSYETLGLALEVMFHKPTFSAGTTNHGTKASKLLDGSSEFALTYEDKDGDWMLVGDVPWGMFMDTVKRLRIMRTSDASGLAASRFQPAKESAGLIRN